jgi:hypothetical protein
MRKSMKLKKIQHRLFMVLFVVLCLVLSFGWAQAENDRERPTDFDGQGTILRVGKSDMIIDDMLYHYEAGTAFYSKSNQKIGSGSFSKGMEVGFVVKKGSYKVLQEVWRIK